MIEQIREDEWFKKNYNPVRLLEYEDVNLDDMNAAFDEDEVSGSSSAQISAFLFLAVLEVVSLIPIQSFYNFRIPILVRKWGKKIWGR